MDFERLYRFQQSGAFFVVRSKKNLKLRRLHSNTKQPDSGIRADQMVVLAGQRTATAYPERLRRVHFRDPATQKKLGFLTNRTDWPATTICDLYKRRWQIELFFKWSSNYPIPQFRAGAVLSARPPIRWMGAEGPVQPETARRPALAAG